jgi:DNA-binding NtrC family response regulator
VGSILKNRHVLILTDSLSFTDFIVWQLKWSGFTFEYQLAVTMTDFTEILEKKLWDIIIAEHCLPRINAFPSLEIRNMLAVDIPFLIVSESNSMVELVTAFRHNCNGYISKTQLVQLSGWLERLWSNRRQCVALN